MIAFFRPTRPQRYNIGEVHGELHFVRNAGAGVVVRRSLSPPGHGGRNRWMADHTRTDAPPAHGHCNGYSDVIPVRDGFRTVNFSLEAEPLSRCGRLRQKPLLLSLRSITLISTLPSYAYF